MSSEAAIQVTATRIGPPLVARPATPLVRREKENVPSMSITMADLASEMHKHIDPGHAQALRALLVALHMGLSLENFCRRVHREMGPEVLRRTMRGLFELANCSAAREKRAGAERVPQADRMHALAAPKRRYFEREDSNSNKRARPAALPPR